MLNVKSYLIEGQPLPDGGWAIWSDGDEQGGRLPVPAEGLRFRLFPWHERSMYGLLLEQGIPGRSEALRLSAYDAVDYLAEPGVSLHLPVVWSRTLQLASAAARLLRQALDKGCYRPDPVAWQQGELGWKLMVPAERQAEFARIEQELAAIGGDLARWFSLAVEELLAQEPTITAAWDELLVQEPLLGRYREDAEAIRDSRDQETERGSRRAGLTAAGTARSEKADVGALSSAVNLHHADTDPILASEAMSATVLPVSTAAAVDEEGWLVSVGWKRDDIPYRVALRLTEPQDEENWSDDEKADAGPAQQGEAWRLSLVLQDKQNAALVVEQELTGASPHAIYTAVCSRKETPKPWLAALERKLVSDLQRIALLVPELQVQEGSFVSGSLKGRLNDEEAWKFLDEDSEKLLQAGFQVYLPSWWEELRRTQPRLKAQLKASSGSGTGSLLGVDQLVKFDWKIAVGDAEFSDIEFARMAAANKRLMRIRGRWVQLDPAFVAAVRKAMKRVGTGGLSFREIMELHLLGAESADEDVPEGSSSKEEEQQLLIEVELNHHMAALIGQLRHTDRIPVVQAPEGLHASLRKYQQDGLSWLLFLRQFGLGACLADDMGLGKTIQFIGYLLHARQEGQPAAQDPSGLVRKRPGRPRKVKPEASGGVGAQDTAVRGPAENQGVSGELSLPVSASKTVEAASPLEARGNRTPGLLICPTSVLGNWQKELTRFAPSLRVYLHYGPQRAKAEEFASAVQGYDLVLTSYTLAQLDEEELSSLIWDVIGLDEAQNIKNVQTKQSAAVRRLSARHRIALTGTPIENRLTELWSIFDFLNPGYLGTLGSFNHKYVNPIEKGGADHLVGQVQKLIKPFLLRRLKKDPAIQLDLPDKYESKAYVPLTLEQATLYENTVQDMLDRLDSLTAMEKKGLILATLTKLKQICDHPALFLKESVDASWQDRSSKLERLLELVEELRDEGDNCLIFTQFVEMGHLLKATLERERGDRVLFLHGGVPKKQRDEMIACFQGESTPGGAGGRLTKRASRAAEDQVIASSATPAGGSSNEPAGIFILSLKAGGTGLNLTAANHVFHFDRWWNPAVENQATDRAFRIGQTRNVQVHKFVALGTLEERIDEMIERKFGLSEQIVGTGENWVTEMSTDELREMFALRRDWVGKA
ncbi:DEAD/DEAH box helicase [Paenibacillus filicis]|uniref:DEAD/DEAH box helicase n=1 Tax=Paenibacillus filicis TaxID=669464 RepID=A0ABU9DSP4_9BACL